MSFFRRRRAAHVQVSVFGKTDVGRTREHNEDCFLVADLTTQRASLQPEVREHEVGPKGSLFMVADGMGGAAAGEVASEMATAAVYEHMLNSWVGEKQRSPQQFVLRLRDAVESANRQIHSYAKEHPELRGMGTTLTAVGMLADRIYLSQVGDSRAYLIRDGAANQLTKDQSLMQRLVDAGELTEEEAERSERKNIILQALGPESQVRVDLTHQRICRGDVLVLCSDGLSGQVSKEELAEAVTQKKDLVTISGELITMANERGGPDNITVVVVRFSGDGLRKASADDAVSYKAYPVLDPDSTTEEVPVIRDDAPPDTSPSALISAGVAAAVVITLALILALL